MENFLVRFFCHCVGMDDIDLHQFVVRKVAALPLYVGSTLLPVPRLNGFSKVVPSSVCNVYNATLSGLPIRRVVSIGVMSSVDDVTSLIIRMEKLAAIIGKDHHHEKKKREDTIREKKFRNYFVAI